MCFSLSLLLRKIVQRQFFLYFAILLFSMAVETFADANLPKELTFVSRGERCKMPNKGESLKPQERCDERRGMVCQSYYGGGGVGYCDCDKRSIETNYDPGSKECRLKVGQFCEYVNVTADPEYYARLSFNAKCHERAECKSDKQENQKNSDDTRCVCKEGYIASDSDGSCYHPNFATSTSANRVLSVLAPLLVFMFLLHMA